MCIWQIHNIILSVLQYFDADLNLGLKIFWNHIHGNVLLLLKHFLKVLNRLQRMAITPVNTNFIIIVNLKMIVILSSNYFSFGILSLKTTFAYCGAFSLVKKILFFFIIEVTVQYMFGQSQEITNLSETLVKSNFKANISWGNI